MLMLGKVHKLEVGAQRFVDGLLDDKFKSGAFYASESGLTGPLGEQSKLFKDLANVHIQNNARAAIESYIA